MVHKEPNSSALTVHYTLSVDSGLSLASANGALTEALKSRAVKSTQQGGATGFWQHGVNPAPRAKSGLRRFRARSIGTGSTIWEGAAPLARETCTRRSSSRHSQHSTNRATTRTCWLTEAE